MECQESQFNEVYNALFKNKNGLSVNALFQQCNTFIERIELSKVLYHAVRLNHVCKLSSGDYKLTLEKFLSMGGVESEFPVTTDETDPKIEEIRTAFQKNPEIKKLMEDTPASVVSNPKVWRVEKKVVQKPVVEETSGLRGSLKRSKLLGGTALAIFKARVEDRGLTISEIAEWIDCFEEQLFSPLRKLIELGYITKNKTPDQRTTTYKWSDKYIYPFSTSKSNDGLELLKYSTLIEFIKRDRRLGSSYGVMTDPRASQRAETITLKPIEPAKQTELPDSPEAIDDELVMLKKRVAALEAQRQKLA